MKKCIKLSLLIITLTVTALLFTSCGEDESEAKLDYYLLSDDTYMVSIDDSSAGKIIIPDTYNGKPVTIFKDHLKYPQNATEIVIPSTLTYVSGPELCNLSNLCEYEDGVTYVGNWAVACDPEKTEINIREGTVGIASGFINIYKSDHYSLKSLTLPLSVKTIADRALEQAKNLQSVRMAEGVEYIGEWAFALCDSLAEIILPEGVKTVEMGAFHGCSSLKKVVLPKSLERIHNDSLGVDGYSEASLYYSGTKEERSSVKIIWGSGNRSIFNVYRWLYYSERHPSSLPEEFWFYVDGHPVPWSEY